MTMRVVGMGVAVTSAAVGILCTSSTNATPIVLTINAGHGLQDGDRINVSGITGNTAANGNWTVTATTATTTTLVGSVGNGAHGGTAAIAQVFDTTPSRSGETGVVILSGTPGVAVLVGTIVIEGTDTTDTSGVPTTFADVKIGPALAAATVGYAGVVVPVNVKRYMRMRCSAFTSGGATATMLLSV